MPDSCKKCLPRKCYTPRSVLKETFATIIDISDAFGCTATIGTGICCRTTYPDFYIETTINKCAGIYKNSPKFVFEQFHLVNKNMCTKAILAASANEHDSIAYKFKAPKDGWNSTFFTLPLSYGSGQGCSSKMEYDTLSSAPYNSKRRNKFCD